MRRVRSAVALCALTFATGCGTGCDELDKNGRLGNGEFQYECVGPGDAACNGTEAILGFDLDRDVLPIAVGGRFHLKFDSNATASSAATLVSVAPDLVHAEGDDFAFTQAATVDFLAKNDEHEVVDFVD